MPTVPASHIEDAHKLEADGIIDLFELTPTVGGTLYFKPDALAIWQGNEYFGLPCALGGTKRSADRVSSQPRLTIGEENIDLSVFKPLLFDGYVDGATLIHRRVLLAHLIANTPIDVAIYYRVKRIESYSRSRILLSLSTASDAMNFSLPNLQYYPPQFPAVML